MLAQNFGPELEVVMSFALDEACRDLPDHFNSHQCRCFVAKRIIECAGDGEVSYNTLVEAGQSAIAEMIALQAKSV